MKTEFADQERLVPRILSRFGNIPNEVITTPEAQQYLRSTIDSAVHFYFYLRERASEPLDINSDEIENVLLDLTAYSGFFWQVRVCTNVFLQRERRSLKLEWEQFNDLESLKRSYFASYDKLVSESTSLKERYLHLLRLTKIQLIFAGIVFT
jgi:hypothetical protein